MNYIFKIYRARIFAILLGPNQRSSLVGESCFFQQCLESSRILSGIGWDKVMFVEQVNNMYKVEIADLVDCQLVFQKDCGFQNQNILLVEEDLG